MITETSNTTGKCVKIQHCPKLFDIRIAEFAGSIISITTGNPDKEKELRKELTDARKKCPNEDTDEGNLSRGIENCSANYKVAKKSCQIGQYVYSSKTATLNHFV